VHTAHTHLEIFFARGSWHGNRGQPASRANSRRHRPPFWLLVDIGGSRSAGRDRSRMYGRSRPGPYVTFSPIAD
jgi:hypothetical protein